MMLKPVVFLMMAVMVSCSSQLHRALRIRRSEMTEKEKRLPHDQCGRQKIMVTKAIVGGRPAKLGEFPWMALVGYRIQGRSPSQVSWLCGGSLITEQYVITAAHCLDDSLLVGKRNGSPVKYLPAQVRLGELNLDPSVTDGAHPQDVDIEKFIIHKSWTRLHQINDLGLIKMKEKIRFSDYIRPICLPPTRLQRPMFTEEDFPVVAGWGRTSFNDPIGSSELMKVRVKVANQASCRANLTSVPLWVTELKIDDSVLCAGTKGRDSCKGDSGGPLTMYYEPEDGSPGRQFMIGVVSYGLKCGLDGYPGVYSRVSYHMPWILQNMEI